MAELSEPVQLGHWLVLKVGTVIDFCPIKKVEEQENHELTARVF